MNWSTTKKNKQGKKKKESKINLNNMELRIAAVERERKNNRQTVIIKNRCKKRRI